MFLSLFKKIYHLKGFIQVDYQIIILACSPFEAVNINLLNVVSYNVKFPLPRRTASFVSVNGKFADIFDVHEQPNSQCIRRLTAKYRENESVAVLSRYFNVIHQSGSAAPHSDIGLGGMRKWA